jgi:hypothetical protein
VIDLEGGLGQRLASSSRLTVGFAVPAGEVEFDTTGASEAIARLRCTPR